MTVALFVLRNADGNYLMEYRHSPKAYKDRWAFPGGKVEDGETSSQTMVREAQEELGITPTVWKRIETAELMWTINEEEEIIQAFLVTQWEGEVPETNNESGDALDWKSCMDILSLNPLVSTIQILFEVEHENLFAGSPLWFGR